MGHDYGAVCECVVDHSPVPRELHIHHILPLYAGGPDTPENRVWLCPTAHVNVHELIRFYEKTAGYVPWSTLRLYSPYVRRLAKTAWEQMKP